MQTIWAGGLKLVTIFWLLAGDNMVRKFEVPMKNPIRIIKSAPFLGIVVLFSFAFYSCDNAKPKVAAPIHSCEILTISEGRNTRLSC